MWSNHALSNTRRTWSKSSTQSSHNLYNELYHSFLDEFLGQYSCVLQEGVAIIQTVFDSQAVKSHLKMAINQ